MAPQLAAHLESVLSGQHDIQQDEIEGGFLRAPRCSQAVHHGFDLIAFHFEIVLQPQGNARFVFHYQNSGHAFPTPGSSIVNVLPWPGSLATVMAPPCAATIWRTIASPTPEPFTLAAAAALPRTNLRKIALRSDSAMPGPLSRTRMATYSSSTPHSTHTVGWLGEYLIALSTRFRNATEIASGSASIGHRDSAPL